MRLVPRNGGFALLVKVVPGSSRQRIAGEYAGGLKITVTAPPEGGAANEAVLTLLADSLQIPRTSVRLIRGHRSPRKEVLIVGLSSEVIQQRLGAAN